MVRYISFFYLVATALIYIFGSYPAVARADQSSAVAVVYPELAEPYRGVISSIVEGVQEQSKYPVKLFPLGDDHDISQFQEANQHQQISAIISLGKTSFDAVDRWRGKIPIIVGASLLVPDKKESGVAGISLAADPEMLLRRLKQLAPGVKKVHVVYSPEHSEWLIDLARVSASKFHLELHAYTSSDIRSSALIYRDILRSSRSGEDAIWLLPDPVAVDSRITLPLLLRSTWNKGIVLFSSNPAHVKRGALFALFPNNQKMGSSLAMMAESYIGTDPLGMQNKIVPLRNVLAAINVRTAEHIGLTVSNEERKAYDLVFPAP